MRAVSSNPIAPLQHHSSMSKAHTCVLATHVTDQHEYALHVLKSFHEDRPLSIADVHVKVYSAGVHAHTFKHLLAAYVYL